MTGCASASTNTDACRELLNIEGELTTLVNTTDTSADELLPAYLKVADDARNVDAEGAVRTIATTLGNVAQDFHDALEDGARDSMSTGHVDSSILNAFVDAGIDMRNVCSEFLP